MWELSVILKEVEECNWNSALIGGRDQGQVNKLHRQRRRLGRPTGTVEAGDGET